MTPSSPTTTPSKPTVWTKEDAQVYVSVNGVDYQGWLSSTIERSIDNLAATFDIPVSLIPGAAPQIARQDLVKVRINDTLVATGYALVADPFYQRNDCGLRVSGRSRVGDMVQCAAIHAGGQWRGAKIDQIARDIAAPFEVEVVVETDVGAPIAEFKLEHGEKAVDALARAARLRGVLVTTNAQGQLLITRAGTQRSHGAIVRGLNVISMEPAGSDEDRFSHYIVKGQGGGAAKKTGARHLQPLAVGQTAGASAAKSFEKQKELKGEVRDEAMQRYLPLVVNAEGNKSAADMQKLAEHTMRVKRGQALGIRYTVEGWTWEGKPWEINTLVPVWDDIAGLEGALWLICSVRSTVDRKEGDVTELLVRPPEAYDTIPINEKNESKGRGRKGKGKGRRGRKKGKDGAPLQVLEVSK